MKSCNTSSNPSFLLFQNRVRIFLVLAETRSFTEAAQRIGISQSAVSRSLNDFESELGVNLIQRSVRPVKLSDAGQVLYQMLSDQKQDIDRILFNIRNNNSLKTPLRLGVVESVAKNLSAFIIKEMKSRCSKVTVLTGISSYLLKLLDDDILDVIICPDPFSNRNDLKRNFLFREPSILIFPKQFSQFDEKKPTWESLMYCGLPLIHYHEANAGGKLEQKFFSELGLTFVNNIEVDINALMLSFVSDGMGWGITRPSTLAQHPDLAESVKALEMPPPVISRDVFVITKSSSHENLGELLTNISTKAFTKNLLPLYEKFTPWVKPYLFIHGDKNNSREPCYPDLVKFDENQKTFVL